MKRLLLLFGLISCWTVTFAQKPNIAPAATVTADGTGGGGCRTGACSTLNDLNYGTCGTQEMWISTQTPPSTVVGDDWIEWNWPIVQAFDEMTIHHASATTRSLTGFLMQYWDGSQWIDGETFSNLPQQCINTVTFQRIVASRMRITQFQMTGAGQQSNPNFREIEIFQASTSPDDAGVVSTNSFPAVCPGSYPIEVTIQNFGLNQIDSVEVHWQIDGVTQTPVVHNSLLDTIGGLGNSSAVVTLGSHSFVANMTYNLRAWTALPNSNADTSNFNDTLNVPVMLGAPTGISISNLSSTTAEVSWTTLASTTYGIIYGPQGFDPTVSGTTVNPATTPYIITGLSPITNYDVYVFADCGSVWSELGGPVSFSTLIEGPRGVNCPSNNMVTLFSDDFETQGTWTGDVSTSTGDWNYTSGTTTSSNTGPNSAFSGSQYIYFEASAAGPASMVSPALDMSSATDSAELSFWMHAYGAHVGYLKIAVSTVSASGPFTDTVFNYTQGQLQTASSDPWQQVGVRLDQYTGQVIWLQFTADRTTSFSGDIAIDQLKVNTCGNICLAPDSIVAAGILDTSATLAWSNFVNATSYEVWFGPQGFYQGTLTVGGTKTMLNGSSLVVDTLSQLTCYEFLVRSVCGTTDSSLWSAPVSFCTPCSAVPAPYIETFDNLATGLAGDFGNCWESSPGSPSDYTWQTNSGTTTSSSTGPVGDATSGSGIYVYTEASFGSASDVAELYSPLINLSALSTPELEFAYHMYGSNIDTLFIDIFDGATWTNAAYQINEQQQTSNNDPWKDTIFDLVPYASNDVVQVRWRLASRGCCTGDAAIDDIRISDPVACPTPSNFSLNSSTATSATLSWGTSSTTGATYQVEYGPSGFTQGNGTVVTSTTGSVTISGLSAPNVCQDAYLRAICNAGADTSFWIGPVAACPTPVPCDNMEGYTTGLVDNKSALFKGWAGDGGDGEFSTAQSQSGTQSLHIYDSGPSGFSDIVAVLDSPYTSGVHNVKFSFYIPATFGGYYNILHNYTGPSNVWAIEVYLDANGTATVDEGTNGSGTIGTYNFNVGSWNTVEHVIDLDNDTAFIIVNGVPSNVGWQWSLGSSNMGDQFNAINFYSAANPGQAPNIYFDDFCVTPYVPATCPTPGALSASNITCGEAQISWVSNSGASQSFVEYGPVGFAPGTGAGTLVYTSSPHTITGLTKGTGYEFYVADTCATDTSNVAGPMSFTTSSGPLQAAFTYSFGIATAADRNVFFDATTSQGATTYDWDFGDGSTGTGQNSSRLYTSNGSYNVCLTISGACGTDSICQTVVVEGIGLEDYLLASSLEIYPNPSSGKVRVKFVTENSEEVSVSVMDLSGRLVQEFILSDATGVYDEELDLSPLANGTYMLKLQAGGASVIKRIVKN